jgi:hypothetical protein
MTTVRGKAPLKASFVREVFGNTWREDITLHIEGDGFKVELQLEAHQAMKLIRDMRKQLHCIRDDVTARLNRYVTDAEGPV